MAEGILKELFDNIVKMIDIVCDKHSFKADESNRNQVISTCIIFGYIDFKNNEFPNVNMAKEIQKGIEKILDEMSFFEDSSFRHSLISDLYYFHYKDSVDCHTPTIIRINKRIEEVMRGENSINKIEGFKRYINWKLEKDILEFNGFEHLDSYTYKICQNDDFYLLKVGPRLIGPFVNPTSDLYNSLMADLETKLGSQLEYYVDDNYDNHLDFNCEP